MGRPKRSQRRRNVLRVPRGVLNLVAGRPVVEAVVDDQILAGVLAAGPGRSSTYSVSVSG
jgi:hypothetical protein